MPHERELTRDDLAGVWGAANLILLCLLWGRNNGEPLNVRTVHAALRNLQVEVNKAVQLIEGNK